MSEEVIDNGETIARITGFLASIGIRCTPATAEPGSFLPGIVVRDGGLDYDPDMPFPGDLLHEAGHIAVTDPALRAGLCEVASDPGEEMAAIAWSWAAARAIGLESVDLFHPFGYKGRSAQMIADFEGGNYVGLPLLQWYGMTGPAYPAMVRWLR